jgi:hypothetical protein
MYSSCTIPTEHCVDNINFNLPSLPSFDGSSPTRQLFVTFAMDEMEAPEAH